MMKDLSIEAQLSLATAISDSFDAREASFKHESRFGGYRKSMGEAIDETVGDGTALATLTSLLLGWSCEAVDWADKVLAAHGTDAQKKRVADKRAAADAYNATWRKAV